MSANRNFVLVSLAAALRSRRLPSFAQPPAERSQRRAGPARDRA